MSSFRLNMRKMPQNWCQNPLTPQTEWWSPPSQWPAEGGVTFGRTMSACVYGTIPWKSLLTGTRGRQLLHSTCKTPAGWNPALEDAKEPWLKIRERADFFFPSSFFTKVHLQAGTWVGSQSSYFFLQVILILPGIIYSLSFFFLANFLCQGILLYTFCSFL